MSNEISYLELKQEIVKDLKTREWCYLATSKNDHVRVGLMRLVSSELKVWCYTDNRSRKYQQILDNPNVGIADNNLQLEGTAILKGHPLDEENRDYIDAYRLNQPENYERTANRQFKRSRPEFRVIEIQPRKITLLKMGSRFEENEALILDVVEEKAYRFLGNSNFESQAYLEY